MNLSLKMFYDFIVDLFDAVTEFTKMMKYDDYYFDDKIDF